MHLSNKTLVATVLDELIPARSEHGLAGAGRPEIVSCVQDYLAEDPNVAALVEMGLAAVVDGAASVEGFTAMTSEQRVSLLRSLEEPHPFLMPLVLLHAYPTYYRQPDVLELLGREARPPFPKGYDVKLDDTALLKKLRNRVGRAQ